MKPPRSESRMGKVFDCITSGIHDREEIARRCGFDEKRVHETIYNLVKQGYIERAGSFNRDGGWRVGIYRQAGWVEIPSTLWTGVNSVFSMGANA